MIPTIDLHNFPVESRKLREASEEWGCFRIINHGIPSSLTSEMKKVVRNLLDLPQEIKKRNTDVIAGSGYVAPSQINPLYEALGLYDMASSQAVDTFSSQLNASSHQRSVLSLLVLLSFFLSLLGYVVVNREIITKYAKAIQELAIDIAQKLAESMGLTENVFEGWPCQFRINKYNFTPETVGSSGVQIHTDSGFLTILQDDENIGGLEVMDKSGAFVPVDPFPGTLLVNLGDMSTVSTLCYYILWLINCCFLSHPLLMILIGLVFAAVE